MDKGATQQKHHKAKRKQSGNHRRLVIFVTQDAWQEFTGGESWSTCSLPLLLSWVEPTTVEGRG